MMLECHELTKVYPNGVRALRGVSLQVKAGEFLCLTGRSGSGKTTLLNCFGTLDSPTAGSVLIDRKALQQFSKKEILEYRRHFLGFVFQQSFLVPFLSVAENIALPLVYQGVAWGKAKREATKILEEIALGPRAEEKARFLSGGEAQRVAVGRAVVQNPKLLLADEPTGELDTETAHTVVKLLKSQQEKGTTLIVVSHDPAVMKSADRVVELIDGKIGTHPIINNLET